MKTISTIAAFEEHTGTVGLDEPMLPGERTTGRLGIVTEPQRPAAWEDRVRDRRLRHVGLVAAKAS